MKGDPPRVTCPCHTRHPKDPPPVASARRGSAELQLGRKVRREEERAREEKARTASLPRPVPSIPTVTNVGAQGRSRSVDRQQVRSVQNVNKSEEDNLGQATSNSSSTPLHTWASNRLNSKRANNAGGAVRSPNSQHSVRLQRMRNNRESRFTLPTLGALSLEEQPKASISLPVITPVHAPPPNRTNNRSAECGNCSGKCPPLSGDPADVKKVITLWQNYYPEGQWGWIIVTSAFLVQAIAHGSQLAYSFLSMAIDRKFNVANPLHLGILGSFSFSISLIFSPIWVSICKRKSTRLAAIFGGLVAALGCLFTSFASQFHQLFVSYGVFIGIGVGFSRDASCLMVGQYFKRKRDFVEIIIVSGSGVGLIVMTTAVHYGISTLGWRLGLQAVTVCILAVFFLGIFYRSASLYHPQRRAILHLKNQRRKIKEKYKKGDSLPFFDWTCLKSKTIRILLVSSAFTSMGINTPLFYLSWKCQEMQIDDLSIVLLHVYLGTAWVIGSILFGILVIQKNEECRISKQYLCQGSGIICGLSIVGLTFVQEYNGLGIFVWVYGFSIGAYYYSVKVYTFDRARARHFPRAWSLVQFSQGLLLFVGNCVAGVFLSSERKHVAFYASAGTTFCGAVFLFLADVRRRKLAAQGKCVESFKVTQRKELCKTKSGLTFIFPSDAERSKNESGSDMQPSYDSSFAVKRFDSISEDGFAEIDFQDIYYEDWEMFAGDGITSCNKVENCLASEADSSLFNTSERLQTVRESRRLKKDYYRYSAIDGISGPAIQLATGVVGIRTPERHHLCQIAEGESFSSPSQYEDNSSTGEPSSSQKQGSSELLEIPSYETLRKKKHSGKGMEESSA